MSVSTENHFYKYQGTFSQVAKFNNNFYHIEPLASAPEKTNLNDIYESEGVSLIKEYAKISFAFFASGFLMVDYSFDSNGIVGRCLPVKNKELALGFVVALLLISAIVSPNFTKSSLNKLNDEAAAREQRNFAAAYARAPQLPQSFQRTGTFFPEASL